MSKKPTGLAAFTSRGTSNTAEAAPSVSTAPEPMPRPKKARGEGATVALTVRLKKADWMRLHQLAMSRGTSLQGLTIDGLSKVLADDGLDPITP